MKVCRYSITLVLVLIWNYCTLASDADYSIPPQISVSQPIRLKHIKSNSVILGSRLDRFALKCWANYPVQWIYRGGGSPEFVTRTIMESGKSINGEVEVIYKSELIIISAKEEDTGEYRCVSTDTEFPESNHVFYHIYVPGRAIFMPSSGRHLFFSANDTILRIPCTVSQPQAQVSLHKSNRGVLEDAIQGTEQYNPRKGFQLPIDAFDPTGTYVCTAKLDKLFRLIEYTVSSKEYGKSLNSTTCDSSSCGGNAYCSLLGKTPVCQCRDKFFGNPYLKSGCTKSCTENTDCSTDTFCNRSKMFCEDPCENYSCDLRVAECKVTNHLPRCFKNSNYPTQKPCGGNENCGAIAGSECVTKNGVLKCTCIYGFINTGFPEVSCTSSCQQDNDCPLAQSCDYPMCVNNCLKFNPCNENEICHIVRHSLVCLPPPTTKKPWINPCDQISCPQNKACILEEGRPLCIGLKCETDEDCSSKEACRFRRCTNPCSHPDICFGNRDCTVINHSVICRNKISESTNDYSPRCPFNLCSGKTRNRTRNLVVPPLLREPSSTQYELVLS